MFDTIFFRENKTTYMNLVIPGVGTVHHEFMMPEELRKAVMDYAIAQANLKVAEIQANMTARAKSWDDQREAITNKINQGA